MIKIDLTHIFPDRSVNGVNGKPVTWQWFWPVLFLGLAARLLVAGWGDVPLHPDEFFQYLEPAHRLVYGYGVIPWEYDYGIRSWLIPIVIAGIITVAEWLGLGEPAYYGLLVKTVFCILSLLLPIGMYRLAQQLASEQTAILVFLIGCFWHHFLYMAHKPMPSILATYGLIWICLWMLNPAGAKRLLAWGLLSGLVFVLRFQLVPVLGVLNLLALLRLKSRYSYVAIGNLTALIASGLLDLVFWGGFLSSFVDNFRLNFNYDVASFFGRAGSLYLSEAILKETFGLIVLAAFGLLIGFRRLWLFALALGIGFLAFHIPAHKEFRFVIWIIPFALIAGSLVVDMGGPLQQRVTATFFGLWALIVSLVFIARYVGITPYKTPHRDGLTVINVLSRIPDLTGIEFRTPSLPWYITSGYYGLHRPIPVYFSGWHDKDPEPVKAARRIYVSHIISESGESVPEQYHEIFQIGMFTIWRRDGEGKHTGMQDYNMHPPGPDSLPEDFIPLGGKVTLPLFSNDIREEK